MTSTHWLTTIALATALVGTTALARPDQTNMHSARHMRAKAALRVVPNRSQPTQAAYGWKYFTNPRAPHAVSSDAANGPAQSDVRSITSGRAPGSMARACSITRLQTACRPRQGRP